MTDFGGRAEADRLHRIGWPEPVPDEEQERVRHNLAWEDVPLDEPEVPSGGPDG